MVLMESGVDVMEYDSVEDLEDTIEKVYGNANRLNNEMKVLVDQVHKFLDYRHDPEMLRASAEYIEENIPDESDPEFVDKYAREQLENPEEAKNWDKLQEAMDLTEGIAGQFRETYETLWSEFGYSGDDLHEKIEGHFPLETFFRAWEDRPHTLFQKQEKYDERKFSRSAEGSRPTMARYFDIETEDLTSKQRDDVLRAEELERELQSDHGRTLEDEGKHNFWRNHFMDQHSPDNPRSTARWVNRELMMLENTLEGTPAPFNKRKKTKT